MTRPQPAFCSHPANMVDSRHSTASQQDDQVGGLKRMGGPLPDASVGIILST